MKLQINKVLSIAAVSIAIKIVQKKFLPYLGLFADRRMEGRG
jgi:hypothetical protein